MFIVNVPDQCYEFINDKDEFVYVDIKKTSFKIEHSLISIRKWESKWHKPFLLNKEKTKEEMVDYIKCMTISSANIKDEVYEWIPNDVMAEISSYIENPMTATWFNDNGTIGAQKTKSEVITAEIIYYWMIALSIPVEFEKWHLNQLLTLIKVVSIKSGDNQKLDKKTAAQQRAALNAARRAKYKSKG